MEKFARVLLGLLAAVWTGGCSDGTTVAAGNAGGFFVPDIGGDEEDIESADTSGSVGGTGTSPEEYQCQSNADCIAFLGVELKPCVLPICDKKKFECVSGTTFKQNYLLCDDGDACTTLTYCLDGECVGSEDGESCDDGNPCTVDLCDGEGNCLHDTVVGDCDDGDACTTGESCSGGTCSGGIVEDCDDDNACTTEYCSPEQGCVYKLAETGGACDDGNECTADACKPDGTCIHADVGGACDDGDTCTLNDFCKAGNCAPGLAKVCDDGNSCTVDYCEPESGCIHDPQNGTYCNDGLTCNGDDQCVDGQCQGDFCSCTSDAECVDDGNACNGIPFCDLATQKCTPGAPVFCDVTNDGPCQLTVCNTDTGQCEVGIAPGETPCDDGNACTILDMCGNGECSGTPVDCGEDNPCVAGGCDPTTGACAISAKTNQPCDDGDACTDPDSCDGFVCGGPDICAVEGGETTEAGGETTEAGGETTEAGGETTEAGGETTEAGGETTEAGGETTEGGGSSSFPCCSPHAETGCNEGTCESCVCASDPYCCETNWDLSCANTSKELCFNECSCSAGCCGALPGEKGCGDEICEICICNIDPSCCTEEWTALCGVKAGQFCAEQCSCLPLQGGDCCADGFGNPGCGNIQCQDCVCDKDNFCCSVAWDLGCIGNASSLCLSECGCQAPPPIDCCGETQTNPGCGNLACESCVCDVDPTCCALQWDASCMNDANALCQDACGCEPGSNCCSAMVTYGCDDETCEDCVCALDDFCCTSAWDVSCANKAIFSCGDSCDCPDGLGNSTGDCCAPNGTFGCVDGACELCVCELDSFCCTDVWDKNCTSWASDECFDTCQCAPECGDGICQSSEDCDSCSADCGPCQVLEQGSCCEVTQAEGCLDTPCEDCICALAPYCCDPVFGWNPGCVSLAEAYGPLPGGIQGCGPSCGCSVPPTEGGSGGDNGGSCCEGAPGDAPGCEDPVCESCVCDVDSICCDLTWDDQCVPIAFDACAGECNCGG